MARLFAPSVLTAVLLLFLPTGCDATKLLRGNFQLTPGYYITHQHQVNPAAPSTYPAPAAPSNPPPVPVPSNPSAESVPCITLKSPEVCTSVAGCRWNARSKCEGVPVRPSQADGDNNNNGNGGGGDKQALDGDVCSMATDPPTCSNSGAFKCVWNIVLQRCQKSA